MDKIVVACAQQQMRIYESAEAYQQDLNRFLRLAATKGTRVVVFPECAGAMLAMPLMSGVKVNLLRAVERSKDRQASWWTRTRGKMAATAAGALGNSLRGNLERLLQRDPQALRSLYTEIFSRAAREWGMVVVAGSSYLSESETTAPHNQALVFGPDGALLGTQGKLHLLAEERSLAEPSSDVAIFDTPVGRIGILFGVDALYPEMGRILALRGAQLLICLAACSGRPLAHKVRQAFEARVQENQLFGAIAFLVGRNLLAADHKDDFTGRSAVLAPAEMTPRGNGILVELGTESNEGLVAGSLDFGLLGQVQALSETPLRRAMRMDLFARHLPGFYSGGQSLQEAARQGTRPAAPALAEPPVAEPAPAPLPAAAPPSQPPEEAPAAEGWQESPQWPPQEEQPAAPASEAWAQPASEAPDAEPLPADEAASWLAEEAPEAEEPPPNKGKRRLWPFS
ncbi:MAG: hypothetical protein GX605_10790 [Chloroflexi bacterium]|nr:hypothetical protein [Chloroflexota bacterium]